eukprot:741270-Rhodomonas_salina.1
MQTCVRVGACIGKILAPPKKHSLGARQKLKTAPRRPETNCNFNLFLGAYPGTGRRPFSQSQNLASSG